MRSSGEVERNDEVQHIGTKLRIRVNSKLTTMHPLASSPLRNPRRLELHLSSRAPEWTLRRYLDPVNNPTNSGVWCQVSGHEA